MTQITIPAGVLSDTSIDLRIHEPPTLTDHEELIFKPRMVLKVEVAGYDVPQLRVMGEFPEDMYVNMDSGYEILTADCSRKFWIC